MRGVDSTTVAAFQHRVARDADAIFEDADFVDVILNFYCAFPCRFGDRVVVAIDRDHTLVADTPFNRKHRVVRNGR